MLVVPLFVKFQYSSFCLGITRIHAAVLLLGHLSAGFLRFVYNVRMRAEINVVRLRTRNYVVRLRIRTVSGACAHKTMSRACAHKTISAILFGNIYNCMFETIEVRSL